jgi:hypothetical protein
MPRTVLALLSSVLISIVPTVAQAITIQVDGVTITPSTVTTDPSTGTTTANFSVANKVTDTTSVVAQTNESRDILSMIQPNGLIINNASPSRATIMVDLTETFSAVTSLGRFYGATMSGFFSKADPTAAAAGDSVTMAGFVAWFAFESTTELPIGDPITYSIAAGETNSSRNSFSPPVDVPQRSANFQCSNFFFDLSPCDSREKLRVSLRVSLDASDSLFLSTSSADVGSFLTAADRDTFLASHQRRVPAPASFLLLMWGASILVLSSMRRRSGRGARTPPADL